MEEIKLPKFKTKEELEQFAKGQAQEIEALKDVIKAKDVTIASQKGTIMKDSVDLVELNTLRHMTDDLYGEIQSLKKREQGT